METLHGFHDPLLYHGHRRFIILSGTDQGPNI